MNLNIYIHKIVLLIYFKGSDNSDPFFMLTFATT